MRAGMGNILETDSDVASISDGEKERTDGDGMESEALLDVNKNGNAVNNSPLHTKEPDKTADNNVALSVDTNKNISHNLASQEALSAKSGPVASTSTIVASNSFASGTATSSSSVENQVSSTISKGTTAFNVSASHAAAIPGGKSSKTVSPRELPPRSQLIQLKPTMCKPRLNSRNSMESLSEGINRQKNARFVPYEPYRGAVRPMVAADETTKRHSRTASDTSAASTSLEQVIGNLTLNDSSTIDVTPARCSLAENVNENTHDKSLEGRQPPVSVTKVVDAQYYKQGKVIEKQTHALTLLKARLKIAEKDNDDLHKENIRLKKLLVDSLSGDILQSRADINLDHANGIPPSTSESVDTLSNEIEVWRSKFLSSCVLVEQLTKENRALNEAVGAAANILKDIKLSSSLAPAHYEQVNAWLRANKSASTALVSTEDNNADES